MGDILNILSESISKSKENLGRNWKSMNIKLMIRSITEALKLGVSMSLDDKKFGVFFKTFGSGLYNMRLENS